MHRIKTVILSIAILAGFVFAAGGMTSALTPFPTVVAASASQNAACSGLSQVDNSTSATCSNLSNGATSVNSVIRNSVNILSYIVGVAAVFMIIYAGFRYTTAAGDSGRISSAKNTLIYALVGIAVAALAQVLVHTVLKATNV